jgi:hypothetical protein
MPVRTKEAGEAIRNFLNIGSAVGYSWNVSQRQQGMFAGLNRVNGQQWVYPFYWLLFYRLG